MTASDSKFPHASLRSHLRLPARVSDPLSSTLYIQSFTSLRSVRLRSLTSYLRTPFLSGKDWDPGD